jgi:hypothetical protein
MVGLEEGRMIIRADIFHNTVDALFIICPPQKRSKPVSI